MTVLSREIKGSGSRRIPVIWGTHFEAAMPLKSASPSRGVVSLPWLHVRPRQSAAASRTDCAYVAGGSPPVSSKACFAPYAPALIASTSLPVDSNSALVQRMSDENFNGEYGTCTGLRTFIIGMDGAELNVVAGCTDTIVVQ
jgi:hypothetical protein